MEWLESDDTLNDEARAEVALMQEQHGRCFLGIINRYDRDGDRPWLWEWDGGMVRNFEAAFVLPAHDETLTTLLRLRHEAPYSGAEDARRVKDIFDRLFALGGKPLVWS